MDRPKGLLADPVMRQALLGYEGMPTPEAAEGMPTYDPEFLKRLGNALATMPTVQAIKSGLTLPGDVYAGRQPMGLPSETEDLSRVADLAGLAMTGGVAGTGRGGVALGSGPVPRQAIRPDGSVETGWVMRDVERGAMNGRDRDFNRLRSQMSDAGEFTEAELPIRSLIATQEKVNPDYASAGEKARGDGHDHLPAVYKVDGKYYVADGHHRITAASEKSDTAKVRLYDMDEARGLTQRDPDQLEMLLGSTSTDRKGAAALSQGLLGNREPIRAYHGSPHDFDRFDLSKIGTGEGAQAYGHGLYFAENPEVARGYRERLAGDQRPGGWFVGKGPFNANDPVHLAAQKVEAAGGDKARALADIEGEIAHFGDRLPPDASQYRIREALKGDVPGIHKGRMYEVAIHADPERFLDWDKPLREQAKPVGDAIRKLETPYVSASAEPGEAYYRQLGRRASDNPQAFPDLRGYTQSPSVLASDTLREAGIPGIKYLDAGSRAAGDGSRNYVLFDDKIVEILRKYGVSSIAALPPAVQMAISLSQEQQQSPAQPAAPAAKPRETANF